MIDDSKFDIGMFKTLTLDRIKKLSPAIGELTELILTIDRMLVAHHYRIGAITRDYRKLYPCLLNDKSVVGCATRAELVASIIEKANRLCEDQSVPDKDVPDISAHDAGVAELFIQVMLFAAYNGVDLAARVYDKLLFEATRRQPIRDAVVPEKTIVRSGA